MLPTFPKRNPGATGSAKRVVVGETHSCALMTGNDLECWGSNKDRQFGDGTTLDRVTPAFVNVCP
jgi:alpha-tubulin suppressor-like RCC1 family protein